MDDRRVIGDLTVAGLWIDLNRCVREFQFGEGSSTLPVRRQLSKVEQFSAAPCLRIRIYEMLDWLNALTSDCISLYNEVECNRILMVFQQLFKHVRECADTQKIYFKYMDHVFGLSLEDSYSNFSQLYHFFQYLVVALQHEKLPNARRHQDSVDNWWKTRTGIWMNATRKTDRIATTRRSRCIGKTSRKAQRNDGVLSLDDGTVSVE